MPAREAMAYGGERNPALPSHAEKVQRMPSKYTTPRPWLGPFILGVILGAFAAASAIYLAWTEHLAQ